MKMPQKHVPEQEENNKHYTNMKEITKYRGYTVVSDDASGRQGMGLLDKDGKLVVPCEMDMIEAFDVGSDGDEYFSYLDEYGFIPLTKNGKIGFYFSCGVYLEPMCDEWIFVDDLSIRIGDKFFNLIRPEFTFEESSLYSTGWAENEEWLEDIKSRILVQ